MLCDEANVLYMQFTENKDFSLSAEKAWARNKYPKTQDWFSPPLLVWRGEHSGHEYSTPRVGAFARSHHHRRRRE
jgi:hypothetical protein